MKSRWFWCWSTTIILTGLVVWFCLSPDRHRSENSMVKSANGHSPETRPNFAPAGSTGKVAGEETAGEETPADHPPDPAWLAAIDRLRQELARTSNREAALLLLQEFAAKILSAQPDRAAASLLAFLRSGQDESTGLDFVVGESGLEEWPSLRAFLLDLLGKIDPEAGARYALEQVIPAGSSTTEYAVSLQILWNHGGAEQPTPELSRAWLGLLRRPDWSARPDAAWVESLDFASRIPEAIPQFLEAASPWLARPKEASGKAETAEMVLERMMVRNPGETLAALLENPRWLDEGRGPAVRAALFARFDSTDSNQVRFMKNYLQGLDPESREAAAFYRAFPCHNYGVAPGLSGTADIPDAEEIEGRLRTDLALLTAWQNDPTLAPHRSWMEQAKKRIEDTLGPGR